MLRSTYLRGTGTADRMHGIEPMAKIFLPFSVTEGGRSGMRARSGGGCWGGYAEGGDVRRVLVGWEYCFVAYAKISVMGGWDGVHFW